MNVDVANPTLSIKKQLAVDAPIERAFRVFTANMGAWWPKEHHIGKSPLKDCVVEPKAGGRWYEVTEDGGTCEWGQVLAYDPPRRLVLAWQLNAAFEFDPKLVTEVEVRFSALGPSRTQVDFEHRNIERFGETAPKLRDLMDGGWGQIMESFARTARVD
jgi:uncharacterized protein YndB with AHSA1/START domain